MDESTSKSGRCLCGAVQVVAKTVSSQVGVCHCGYCRTWSGGPLLAVDCGTDVVFDGTEHITTYASSAWAERGFCSRCGTHLFFRLKANGQVLMPPGLFEDTEGFVLSEQIFVDRKPGYYAFANPTAMLTEAEFLAKYGA
ncbi:MAG: GFA family protein [Rhodocyclaceae bacterium]|nr:GFA family protein [Rhodocyclaceae bacterium]